MVPASNLKSIVLIEDNPVDLDLTLRAFKRRRLTNPIEIARDGEEAINLFTHWPPDKPLPVIILLDLKLPKYHGLEVLKQLRSTREFAHIPVVVLTSSSEDRDIEQAYTFGASSYIVKPVDFEKFMAVAEQIEVYWTLYNEPVPNPTTLDPA